MLGNRSHDNAGRSEATLDPKGQAETQLIAQVAAGELRAFEALYRAYHPRLTPGGRVAERHDAGGVDPGRSLQRAEQGVDSRF